MFEGRWGNVETLSVKMTMDIKSDIRIGIGIGNDVQTMTIFHAARGPHAKNH